jgi:diguanylate cyclase (GGDEF)-like protein/hemerythrin-like metal-binding protein
VALGLIDVDWFKKYNDHYGHPAGDECLRLVAKVLSECVCRTGDLVARYGGEEFVFVAPATTAENAQLMAQRICAAMQELALVHELSEFGCVTVSIGVAALIPQHGETADMLVKMADEALYRAKAQGRNRAVCDMTYAGDAGIDRRQHAFVPLVWKDAFVCGNDLIDGQHKVLVQIANELFSAMISERSDADVGRIVTNLLAEAAQHFHDEEVLLRQLQFDKLDQHVAEHAQLLAQAKRLVGEFELNKLTLGSLFQFLAHDVIIRHMLGSDREYFGLFTNPPA